jgi:hypothetical protein
VTITDEEITRLRTSSQQVQNWPLAALCRKALNGDETARERVARIISDAADARLMGDYLTLKAAYDRAVADYGGALDEVTRTRGVRDSARTELQNFTAKLGDATRDDPLCCQRYGLIHTRDLAVPGCRWFEPEARPYLT